MMTGNKRTLLYLIVVVVLNGIVLCQALSQVRPKDKPRRQSGQTSKANTRKPSPASNKRETSEVTSQRATVTSVPVAEGETSKLPVGYTGHNPATIFTALRAARPSLRKGQYETTPDYESRVEGIVSQLPGVSSRLTFLLPDVKIKYDADAGAFRIDTQPESVLFPEVFMSGDFTQQYSDFTSFYLVWTKKTAGSAVGRNAFGVRKRIIITVYTSLRLAVPSDSVKRLNSGILLPAPPAVAPEMAGGIRFALTGYLIPPLGGEETDTDTATISDPEEAHYFKYYIYFKPDTAIAYDVRTGEVYGSVDLAKESPAAYGQSYRYQEPKPVTLEDPLSRQRRLEESQRDYPPDHVFLGTEVDQKARIISRPLPSYPEEARKAQVSGTVKLRGVLKYDGTVEILSVIEGLPNGVTERAIEAAKKVVFEPARRNNKPVSQFMNIEYTFNLY